jgi:hypothetical protein
MKTNSQNNPEFRVELSGHVLENALRREVETRNEQLIYAIMHFVPNDTLYKVLVHDYPEPQFAVGDTVDVIDVARGRIPVAPCTPFVVQNVSVFGSYRQQPEYTIEYGCMVQKEEGEELYETRTIRVEQSQVVASGEQFALQE